MLQKKDYIEYLLSTPFNYTCMNLADHKPSLSHDSVSDFLRRERFTPLQLWASVAHHIEDSKARSSLLTTASRTKSTLTSSNWSSANTLEMNMVRLKK